MNLIKSSIVFPIVIILCSIMWNGCYTQFAASSDESEPTVDPNQSAPPDYIIDPMPYPIEPYPGEPYHPRPVEPPSISPGHIGTVPPASRPEPSATPPRRESGYQRSPSTDQNNSRQTDTTPPRTSWSPAPAPAPQNPPASPPSNTHTSGSARR